MSSKAWIDHTLTTKGHRNDPESTIYTIMMIIYSRFVFTLASLISQYVGFSEPITSWIIFGVLNFQGAYLHWFCHVFDFLLSLSHSCNFSAVSRVLKATLGHFISYHQFDWSYLTRTNHQMVFGTLKTNDRIFLISRRKKRIFFIETCFFLHNNVRFFKMI